ncbi:hypothetical protein D3C77_759310 [compost metagenome]
MHAQLTGAIEQQDERATADQAAFTQFSPGQRTQYLIGLVDPGDQLTVGSRTVGGFLGADGHYQPCDSN